MIEIDLVALRHGAGFNGRPKSHGTSTELESQRNAANSTRASRQSNRTRRRENDRVARGRLRELRQVEGLLETELNSIKGGNQSRTTTTFSNLQRWRQRGRMNTEDEVKISPEKEKSPTSGDDVKFTGVVIGDDEKNDKTIKNERMEEDGILLVVPAKIRGKEFRALIDSGATRCFVTPECCAVGGLSCIPHDTFLELGNGQKALSRGLVQDAPITLGGVTTKTDLTVSNLLHNVDIVLGINWLKFVNPFIDWSGGRVILHDAIHTALLKGTWLSPDIKIGTVKILSSEDGLEQIKNAQMRNSLAILKTPKFWSAINSRSNFSTGDVQKTDCEQISRKLFIRSHPVFGHLYVKKLRNNAAIPKRGTEEAAGYDVASSEEVTVPAKGKVVVKTGISVAVPEGCYGRIAPRSGLAVKKFIDVGAGVIDADYRGEVGVVLFNHSEEDFKVKPGDRIAQLILEKIDTPQVKEVEELPDTTRVAKGFGSTGWRSDEKSETDGKTKTNSSQKDSSRVTILQRVQGQPKIKTTNAARLQREFVSIKKMKKLMKQKEHVFLCIVKADQSVPEKRNRERGKRKSAALSSASAQDSQGLTEKTKREHSKAVGPKKDFKTVEEKTEEVVKGVAIEHQTKLRSVIAEFRDVFKDKLPTGPPPKREVAHSIEVHPGSEPTYRTPYRLRPAEQDELEEQVRDLLAQGFIRPSQSPYGAPVLFVPKKDGRWRMCIDYRALNRQTVKDRYPLPRIDTLLDRLGQAKVFTKLDLASGYHQIAMDESSIFKTAFTTSLGQWEFLVMPFGLCNAPATFQRLMNRVFTAEINNFILVYLDDILIFSNSLEEHWDHLRTALERLREAKLYGRIHKCEFLKTRVDYLGYEVSSEGVHASPEKVKAIVEWPKPQSSHDVRSFLGLASYYRRFIHGFSQISGPLTELTKSKAKWRWEKDQERSFLAIKIALATAPVLRLPDFDHQFIVTTDASDVAIGAILQQDVGMGLQPIAFASRKLQQAEVRYSAYERELLGIVWALGQWKHYFQGPHPIIIQTDHAPLRHLPNQASVNSRIWKWLSILQGYDVDIQHIPGKRNPADSLSRQSVSDALVKKGSVHDANEAYVQQLRVATDASDEDIQEALEKLFRRNPSVNRGRDSILKMSTSTEEEKRAGILDKPRPVPSGQSVPSKQSDSSSISVQDQSQAVQDQSLQGQQQAQDSVSKLAVYRSRVRINSSLKDSFYSLLKNESPYDEILRELENGKIEVKRNEFVYKKKNGMLVMHQAGQGEELDYWRMIVPDDVSTRNFIVTELHAVPYSIHPGVQRTIQRVRKSFYWKGMTGNIREFVETCPVCQMEKADHTLSRGKLQSTQIPESKWKEISLDFITDLPVTRRRKDSILTVVDKATRMVHLLPCRKAITAAETATLVWENVVKLHGVPTAIYSDRGTQFTSQFWKTLWGLTGTQLKFSTAYHPQSQGIVERMNSIVSQSLRCLIHESNGAEWDSLLPMVELTINSLPNSSTGYSPFFLNYGFHPTVPVELLKGDEEVSNESVNSFVSRVRRTWDQARENLEKSVRLQQKYYNQRHRSFEFEEGDLVLLSSKNLSMKGVPGKLKRKFVGPFKVIEKIGTQAYKLQLPESWKIHNVFHVSLLKEWKSAYYRKEPEDPEMELDIEDRHFEVDKILRWRKKTRPNGTTYKEYLVLWTNYPMEEATWEPKENFDDPEAFEESLRKDNPQGQEY